MVAGRLAGRRLKYTTAASWFTCSCQLHGYAVHIAAEAGTRPTVPRPRTPHHNSLTPPTNGGVRTRDLHRASKALLIRRHRDLGLTVKRVEERAEDAFRPGSMVWPSTTRWIDMPLRWTFWWDACLARDQVALLHTQQLVRQPAAIPVHGMGKGRGAHRLPGASLSVTSTW